jgi:transcriptional regulator with XRE-family HTH domain
MSKSTQPNKTDILIGKNLFEARQRMRYSQSRVAQFIGVSYQQIQKYEKGIDRLSMENLQILASSLGVSVHYFFTYHNEKPIDNSNVLEELLLTYFQLNDSKKRAALLDYSRSLVKEQLLEDLNQKS